MQKDFHLPIQKCLSGKEVKELSDIELLAVIIGNGSKESPVIELAAHIYNSFKGLAGIYRSGIRELSSIQGIGKTKAIRLHSSLEAGRRIISSENLNPSCESPLKVWQFLLPEIACLKQEEFRVIVLNNKNHVLRITRTSVGTLSEAIVHPREIFRDAIRESGSSVILVHNHPSGVLIPSREDIEITKRINEAGKIIGIRLLDHLIVSELSYLSMKEDGYIS